MLDIKEQSRDEFLESQSKEQLIIFLKNTEYANKILREKLKMLTGCSGFGNQDCMDGSCVDCYYEEPELHAKCCQFQNEFRKKMKKRRNNIMNNIPKIGAKIKINYAGYGACGANDYIGIVTNEHVGLDGFSHGLQSSVLQVPR